MLLKQLMEFLLRKCKNDELSSKRNTKYTKKGLVTGLNGGYKKAIVQLAEGESIDFYNNL